MKKRILAMILAAALALSCVPEVVFAAAAPPAEQGILECSQVNPLYVGIQREEDLRKPGNAPDTSTYSASGSVEYESDENVLAAQIREAMVARQADITVYWETESKPTNAIFSRLVELAIAETGNPDEGDYIRYTYGGWSAKGSFSQSGSVYRCTLTYAMTYYTTAEQEQEMNTAVRDVLSGFGFASSTSNVKKIRTIYDYICTHVTYDYDNLEDDSYKLKFTAYAALVNGTAVCQGYAVLLYRLLLESGVSCRVIAGTGNGGAHAWNIAGLNGVYYNADSTWDASNAGAGLAYEYYLRCDSEFPNHTRNEEFTTEAFYAAYPMSETSYESTPGDETVWTLSEDGALTVSGSGPMADYAQASDAPWYSRRTEITEIAVESGVTSVGARAFCGCTALTDVRIADTVGSIGAYAFQGAKALQNVIFSGNAPELGENAFADCAGGFVISYYEGTTGWDSAAWAGYTKQALHVGEWIVDTAPTCAEPGSRHIDCTYCGKTITESIPTTEHTVSVDAAVEPTCTEDGLTEGSHCSVCGAVLVKQETVPATGHTEAADPAVPATCTEDGLTEGSHCSICGAVLVKQETIPAAGHSWDDGAVTREPTETEEGTRTYTCTICGETRTEKIPTLEHVHNYTAVVTEPTCTEEGYTTYTCACGDSYVDDKVPALGHTEAADAAVEPTCTETGLTEGSHCSVCGAVLVKQETVPATGHTEAADPAVPATCTEDGLTEGSHCSVCGAVLVKQETVPAAGHNWDGGTVTKEATETEAGVRTYTCTVCGETKTEEIPPLSHVHSYTAVVTEPTCTEAGYTTYTCACGDSYVDDKVPALGHTEVADAAVEPTATQTGLTEGSHCAVCGEILKAQAVIPALGLRDVTMTDAKPYVDGVIVSWEAVEEARFYQLFRRAADETSWTLLTNTSGTAHKDSSAEADVKYYYKARARDGSVMSSLDIAAVSAKIPTSLADVKMESAAAYPDGIIVRWGAVEGAILYQVYRRASGETTWTLLRNTGGLAYKDTEAVPGVRYYYRAVARNCSLASSINIPAVSACITPPADVKMLSATGHSTGNIIRWEASEGATLYQVFRREANETAWTLIKNTSGTAYKDETAEVGVKYYYKVRARNGGLMSSLDIPAVSAVRPGEQ